MSQSADHPQLAPPHLERLTARGHLKEIMWGVGASLGLGLLWVLEIARDAYFAVLDRINVKPRRRRASAFPPGRPRKRRQAN
ncbi:MAG: hypothetical protein ACREQB_10265 [Candidatus Binataceae bacterium]